MPEVLLGTALAIGGDFLGRKLGNKAAASLNNNAAPAGPAVSAAPTVPAPVTSAAPTTSEGAVIDTAAAAARASKRRTQAQDLSLFTLGQSSSSTQDNSLLGL